MSAGDIISEKVLREEIIPCNVTTRLTIGDPQYLEDIANGTDTGNEKNYVFDGKILRTSAGQMRIRQIHVVAEGIAPNKPIEIDLIEVRIVQASRVLNNLEEMLDTYMKGEYYDGKLDRKIAFGCDTASFVIETKYGSDLFHTGADGCYGYLTLCKSSYGMILDLDFDGSLFSFDEIKERMLKLFPRY